tara:strand:- start:263 stop:499 length:237 start_codon:yes stop_codon:yes gene_type:complete
MAKLEELKAYDAAANADAWDAAAEADAYAEEAVDADMAAADAAYEAMVYDYWNKPLDSAGWTQADYDYSKSPLAFCEE